MNFYKIEEINIRNDPYDLGHLIYSPVDELFEQSGRNSGNLLYIYAIHKMLSFPIHKNWVAPISANEKVLVYPMANQLGKHYNGNNLSSFFESLPDYVKVVIAGIGAQAHLKFSLEKAIQEEINESHIKLLNSIIKRAPTDFPNIAVRGEFTQALLEKLGFKDKSIVLGCPSFTISPFEDLGLRIANRFDRIDTVKTPVIHFTLGAPWVEERNKFEKKGVNICMSSGGRIHVQMDLRYAKFARCEDLDNTDKDIIAKHLDLDKNALEDISRKFFSIWWNVPSWIEFIKQNADFVFGTRIHGVMAAIQAGVPALCVVVDRRTLELCQTHKIPYVSLYEEPWISGSYSWQDVLREFEKQFDPIEFDRNRLRLLKGYKEFFEKNLLQANIEALSKPTYDNLTIKGFVDLVDKERLYVSGWVINNTDPKMKLTVEVYADNKLVGKGIADKYRNDLEKSKIGDGQCAFKIDLPKSLADGKDHTISVRVKYFNLEIKNSPITLTFPDLISHSKIDSEDRSKSLNQAKSMEQRLDNNIINVLSTIKLLTGGIYIRGYINSKEELMEIFSKDVKLHFTKESISSDSNEKIIFWGYDDNNRESVNIDIKFKDGSIKSFTLKIPEV